MTAALEALGAEQKSKKELDRLYKSYLNEAYNKLDILLKQSLEEQARKQYNYMYRAIERGVQQNLPRGTLTSADIRRAINRSIGGYTIGERLSRHKATLFKNLTTEMQKQIRQGIAEGMSQGDSIDRMTKTIKQQMNTSRYNARRIARTEAHRIREWGNNWAMRDAKKVTDMFDKEWLATSDSRTRDTHRRLNGQFADEKGYFHVDGKTTDYPGNFGIASEDIHCRCTMVANFDKSIGKDDYINQDNLTNEEWANKPDLPAKYTGLSTKLQGDDLNKVLGVINGLNSVYYPKSVISELLQSEFTEKTIDDKLIKERLRTIYLKYLKKSYSDIGINLRRVDRYDNAIENETLGKQYALIKHIQDKTGVQLKELTFLPDSDERTAGYFRYYKNVPYGSNGYMAQINLTQETYTKSEKARRAQVVKEAKAKWHGRTLPNGDDTVLTSTVHEIGHLLDYSLGWKSNKVDYSDVYYYSDYAKETRKEAAAEAFTEVIFNPTEEATTMWKSMGIKTEGLNDVDYAKILR